MRRRPYGSLAVETYIYRHNQTPDAGLIVRRFIYRGGRIVGSVSRYFSVYRYGSLSTAHWHARRWKSRHLL